MARKVEYIVKLTDKERAELKRKTGVGDWRVRKVKRAKIILKADEGVSEEDIAKEVGCCLSTVKNIKLKFAKGERLKVLEDKPRPGRPRVIDGEIEAHLTMLACSEAPEGRSRWTLRLMADKLVTLVDDIEYVSYTTVREALKKMDLNLG